MDPSVEASAGFSVAVAAVTPLAASLRLELAWPRDALIEGSRALAPCLVLRLDTQPGPALAAAA